MRLPALNWTVGLLVLTLAALGASPPRPKRVLILDPFGRDVAPFSTAISAFRLTLARELGEPVECYELSLELARYSAPGEEESLVTFLESRLQAHPFDLVVPVSGTGVQFAARHRERLSPETPVVAVAADSRFMPVGLLGTNATLVTQRVDLPGMVEDILQLRPQTTNIVVVFGASALERFWVNECRREFQPFTSRVGFTWLEDLTVDQVLDRCAALPPRSFILHGLFVVDAAGVPCERNLVLRRLHEVATAPVFSYFASELGLGVIGGRLYQDVEVGVRGARTAIRILRGERAGEIPPQVLDPAAPVYDWRELRRWGVREARLPAGRVIRFRQPGLWERYGWLMGGGITFCLLEAALVVGLLLSHAKRRQGEAEATLVAEISARFVNLPPGEVERAILEAQRQICESLGLDQAALWQWSDEAPGDLKLTQAYRAGDGAETPAGGDVRAHLPWSQQQVVAGRSLVVAGLEELPAEAAHDRAVYGRLGIESVVLIPLSFGGEPPLGALGFYATRRQRTWPEGLVKRLQLVAQIVAHALARKRFEVALRDSEERLSLAAAAADVGVWVWDVERNRIWATDHWRRLFGFALDAPVRLEAFLERIHPEDRGEAERALRKALDERSHYASEYRVVRCDGTQRWIAARGRLDASNHGTAARMLGASVDITGRKRTEDAARELSGQLITAQEEERARLARELHDDITQRLARLAIDVAQWELGTSGRSPSQTVREVREGLVRLSEDVHALSYRLHPSVLEDLGLVEALRAEAERFTRCEDIAVELNLREGETAVPPEVALCLFRVVQEALRNVARHAAARAVHLTLHELDDGLQLAVRDDGRGFNPARHAARPSLGLASMRERVHLLGGELDLESSPGQGTLVMAWVPLGQVRRPDRGAGQRGARA